MADMSARPALTARIGTALRAERLRQGLKLDELSRLSGVGIATLSNLENGNRDIRLSTLERLLNALRTDLATLLQPVSDTGGEPGDGSGGYAVEL